VRTRRSPRLPDGLTFGGRVPASVGLVLVLTGAATLLAWMTQSFAIAALVPERILGGELWRLVSWAFVQRDPLTLLFGGFLVYSMGQQLALAWGEGRFLARFFLLAVAASVGATIAALFWAPANVPHLGLWPVANALLLSWALMHPGAQVQLMFVVPVTGKTLALLVVFGTFLYGLAGGGLPGIGAFVPHLAALGLAYAWSRGPLLPTRRWRLQLRDWRQEREYKRRTKHLKVVKKNGSSDEPPRWMN
jgi:membrane associated rhomboid family serine protease